MGNKSIGYQTENFGPINRAIDAEIARQHQLSESLRSQTELNKSLIVLRWAGVAALIIISVSFAFWILTAKPEPKLYRELDSSIDVRQAVERVSENTNTLDAMIKTQFTVFETVTTDTGKKVVTGRVYEPLNLDKPTWQYCYLSVEMDTESPLIDTSNQDILMRTLANKRSDDEVETVTKDLNNIKLAKEYCRFV
ncbi:hypothetical protein [Rheinheimera maricola]|uniref:Uncharacterized protein n=1 Tax=Rheinheimera maricola TaxID=2793282 RepID=A0ABS7XE75_9GAMM|nr:hypothetical protein [Rheinheimera maricola]MBZ9613445.1 hypothetical protein [Rheinheimera maricola]